jgi:hypothetical protein
MSDVDAIEALVRRFPDHARSIRRLQADDATFRAICEDYAEALRALAYWQAADRSSQQKAEEYRRLVEELEEEALEALTRANEGGNTLAPLATSLLPPRDGAWTGGIEDEQSLVSGGEAGFRLRPDRDRTAAASAHRNRRTAIDSGLGQICTWSDRPPRPDVGQRLHLDRKSG